MGDIGSRWVDGGILIVDGWMGDIGSGWGDIGSGWVDGGILVVDGWMDG